MCLTRCRRLRNREPGTRGSGTPTGCRVGCRLTRNRIRVCVRGSCIYFTLCDLMLKSALESRPLVPDTAPARPARSGQRASACGVWARPAPAPSRTQDSHTRRDTRPQRTPMRTPRTGEVTAPAPARHRAPACHRTLSLRHGSSRSASGWHSLRLTASLTRFSLLASRCAHPIPRPHGFIKTVTETCSRRAFGDRMANVQPSRSSTAVA